MDFSKYIDESIGLEFCGDQELYTEMLESFIEEYDETKANIEDTYSSKDWATYAVRVHGLKSASKMIGAMPLADKAYELEMAGKESNEALIQEKTQSLLDFYKETVDAISEHIA